MFPNVRPTILRGAKPRSPRQKSLRLGIEPLEKRSLCSVTPMTVYEYESNDSFARAQPISPAASTEIRGSIGSIRDVDFFAFSAGAGTTIKLNVKATNPGAPKDQQVDPVIGLFSPSGRLVQYNDDAGIGSAWAAGFSYRLQETGTWRVAVSRYNDFSFNGNGRDPTTTPGLDTGSYIVSMVQDGVDLRMLGASFGGTTATVRCNFSVAPNVDTWLATNGPFQVALYRSADPNFDASDALVARHTVSARTSTDTFQFSTPLVGHASRPYLLVVADPANQYAESSESNNVAVLKLPEVTAQLPRTEFTLMDSDPFGVRVSHFLADCTSYGIVERAGQSPWHDQYHVAKGTAAPQVTQRLAGAVSFRSFVVIAGVRHYSQEYFARVQFPNVGTIANNPAVFNKMVTAWQQTKAATTPVSRREQGFWIYLNTATGQYVFSKTFVGPTVGPRQTGGVSLGAKPADRIAADRRSAIYLVASFHTHTPATYLTNGRVVGPSKQDQDSDNAMGLPGLVADYIPQVSNVILPGHAVNMNGRVYTSGPAQRRA